MANEKAEAWFRKKAARKALRKADSEQQELQTLKTKYRERPIPISIQRANVPGELPYMTIAQMVRYQSLKLDNEYYPLREQGLSHDEAEERVFPAEFAARKEREATQEAVAKELENEKALDNIKVEDGLEMELA